MSETADFNARAELIRRYLETGKALDRLVQQGYPAGLIDFVPSVDGAWSIREHIVHVLDADLMAFHRLRYAIAEPGTTVPLWDEEAWQSRLGYAKQNVTASVSLFRMLRSLTAAMLEGIDRQTWEGAWSVHPVRGRMTLNDWLSLYSGHVEAHLEYVARNEAAWEAQGGGDRLPCH